MPLNITGISRINVKTITVGNQLIRFLVQCLVLAMLGITHVYAEEKDLEEKIKEQEASLPLEDLQHFTQVFDRIRKAYVEEVDDPTLFRNAIIGMLSQLDPHSAYLDQSAYDELQTNTQGEFGGLGIEVSMENGLVRVVSPIDDTPAKRAGILAGDLIVKLDGTPIKGMTLQQAIEKMRGKKGTSIVLTVLREGVGKPFDVEIVRDTIKVISVRLKSLGDGYAYARIAQFQLKTAEELKSSLKSFQREHDGHVRGVMLDLRNNPGGLLQSAVDVSDLFLEGGLVVYTEGRVEDSNMRFEAREGDMIEGAPIVALINEGSASAAEIVAGALQDQQRAILVGMQTFGKGSVQTVLPLDDDRGIKLTTARYFTPSGRSIQAEGIRPDIVVKPAILEAIRTGERVTEANLDRHLVSSNTDDEVRPEGRDSDVDLWLEKDNQLLDGFNVLKALSIQKASIRSVDKASNSEIAE